MPSDWTTEPGFASRWGAARALPWRLVPMVLATVWMGWNLTQVVQDDPARLPDPEPLRPAIAATGSDAPMRLDIDTPDIATIIGWQLFGSLATAGAPPSSPDGPVAALDALLQGVATATDGSASRAILHIAGRQQSYRVGDALPLAGRVRLLRVAADHVLLDNNGQQETLWLYPSRQTPVAAPPPASPAELPPVPATALTEALQLAEHRVAGELRGYQLQPGRDSGRFTRLGLLPGDRVMAFDKVGLDQPEAALALFEALRERRDLHLLIQRDRQTLTLLVAGSAI